MKSYKIELVFTNIDNSLYTDEQAKVIMNIEADNSDHAVMLAERLRKVFDADHYVFIQ